MRLAIGLAVLLTACGGGNSAPAGPTVLLSDNFTGETFQPATMTSNALADNSQIQAQCSIPLGSQPSGLGAQSDVPVPFAHDPGIVQTFDIPGTWGAFSDAAYFNETASYVPQYSTAGGLRYGIGPGYVTSAGRTMYGWVLVSGQTFDARTPLTATAKITPGMGYQGLAIYANEGDYRELGLAAGTAHVSGGCAGITAGTYAPGVEHTISVSYDGAGTWTYALDGAVVFTDTVLGPLYAPRARVGFAFDAAWDAQTQTFIGTASGTIESVEVTSP